MYSDQCAYNCMNTVTQSASHFYTIVNWLLTSAATPCAVITLSVMTNLSEAICVVNE